MASTLGCQFNFEVPLSILQSVSTSQSGHQYEMLGDFHVNEFSRKHLKVLGENADGIFRFSLKEKQTIEGWHTVFDQVWKCHITSIQSVSTSKPVDDEPLKPSLGTAPAGNLIKKEADFSSEAGGDEDIPYDDIADTCYYDHGDDHDDEEENDTGNETNIKLEVTETKELNLEKVPAKKSQFTCSECNKNFATVYTLRRHIETKHNMKKPKVKPSFSLKNSGHLFEKNLSLCKTLGILPKSSSGHKTGCLVCGKVIAKRCHIGRHITEKHLVPLDRYWEVVTTDDPDQRKSLIDDILHEEFEQRSKKKLEKAGPKMCKCPGCGKLFTAARNVLIHIRTKCCSATANADAETIQELLSKVEALSAKRYLPNTVNRDEYSIACPYCGEPRVGRSIFKHLRVAHASEENLEMCLAETEIKYTELVATRNALRKWNAEATRKSEGILFSCKFCQRQFNDRSFYHQHMKHSCTSNPNRTRRFYCKCGKRYTTQQSLDTHRKSMICQNGLNFQCDVCGKVYTSSSGLYKHRRDEHGHGKKIGKHCCPFCSKRFFEKNRLELHMSCHTDARLFQCEICGKNYKNNADVNQHKKTVHFNKYPYYCKICGHGVAKKKYLAAHKCGKVRRVQDQENPEASSALAQDQKPAISDTQEGAINQLVVAPNDPSTHGALTNIIFSPSSDLFL